MIYLPELGSILEEASDKKSYVPEVHRFQRDEADTANYLPEVHSILEEASNKKVMFPKFITSYKMRQIL